MKRYWLLYAKRILKALPFVLCVTAILFGSLAAVFISARQLDENSDINTKFSIGVVGTGNDTFLKMGLAAFESMDTTRFALELVYATEEEAQALLTSRNLSAYVIFPDDFMTSALSGEIHPLKYVCSTGSVGMSNLLKEEITQVIESILLSAQKGAYGAHHALQGGGFEDQAWTHLTNLSIEYVELVLDRGKVYTVQELGVSDGLDMEGHLISGLSVLFLLLICIPYAPLLIRNDRTMEQLLASRSIGCTKQISTEIVLYFASLLLIVALMLGLLLPAGLLKGYEIRPSAIFQILSVLIMVATWSFFLFELSKDLISGVLLQFFSAVCLAFISGCLYPVYFFPKSVQTIGNILPTGAARMQLAHCLSGTSSPHTTWLIVGYSSIFLSATFLLRFVRIRWDRG